MRAIVRPEGHRPRRTRPEGLHRSAATFQGKPATVMAVYQQPGANALDVSNQVRKTLAEMKKTFPEGLEYEIAMDTTEFTRASISDVVHTFFEALVLVVIVVFVFLQSLRATLIPVLAVPVSHRRHLHGHAGARLLDQHADALRHGARHRHRGGRRDRRDRERRAQHERAQAESEGCGQARDGRGVGPGRGASCSCCARCSCRWRSSAASRGSCTSSSRSRSRSRWCCPASSRSRFPRRSPRCCSSPDTTRRRASSRWFDNVFGRMTAGYTSAVKLVHQALRGGAPALRGHDRARA